MKDIFPILYKMYNFLLCNKQILIHLDHSYRRHFFVSLNNRLWQQFHLEIQEEIKVNMVVKVKFM